MVSKKPKPTESELEILKTLWELGPTTVRNVHSEISKHREIGYTTVLKLMQIMTEKGLLLRDESQRSHVYKTKQKAESTQKQLLKDFVARAFGGSTEKLVMQALASKRAKPEELAEIRRMLDELEDNNREQNPKSGGATK